MLKVSWEMLRTAIGIYVKHAYPGGAIPEIVRKRIGLDESKPLWERLNEPPFENYTADAPFHCTVYALRLGSEHYPHLKMEIRPFTNELGFMFWVNTHDQFVSPKADFPDVARWRQVIEKNSELKQAVERAWAKEKLPTFASAMQEGIDQTSSSPGPVAASVERG